ERGMVACTGETAMQRQARAFIATTAAQGLEGLAERIALNPHCEATVTTTNRDAHGLGQTTLAVFRTSRRTGYRDELFVCVIYAYVVDEDVSVDVLLRPGIVGGERHGMASGPLCVPGLATTHWSELTVGQVRAYVETLFRAALVRPKPPERMQAPAWKREILVPQAG
ncbi:MAG: hypothetical protein ACRDJC_25395, partial [Thermomicrobiales bacterium]